MSSNSSSGYIFNKNECLCSPKDLYKNIYSSIIHNSKIWKQIKCPSTVDWVNKLWHIHTVVHYVTAKQIYMQQRGLISQTLG